MAWLQVCYGESRKPGWVLESNCTMALKVLNCIDNIYPVYLKHPSICIDSRKVKKNAIFFALKGENFDGNKFAQGAIDRGCSYAIVSEKKHNKNVEQSEKFILVENVLATLQELAKHHRKQLKIPVIGITGTNGKTTTKNLVKDVLIRKYNTYATHGNLNNHIGVPLSVLSIKRDIEIAIIEMGASHQGEIADLCNIAQPNYGLITNIGKAHLEGFGSFEGVIKSKKELYNYLSQNNGIAFVNSDNLLLMDLSDTQKRVTYQSSKKTIKTLLTGKHNIENIMAAMCIGHFFGVEKSEIERAIESYQPSNNRSQIIKTKKNKVLLDAYNANPMNMEAVINHFSQIKAKNKVIILGDMLELGTYSLQEHRAVTELLKKQNFNRIILVGDNFSKVKNNINCEHFADTGAAAVWLKNHKIRDAFILIKGSRGIGLEKIMDVL